MKVTYDKELDVIYIQFKEDKIEESDEDKNGNMIVDYASDGSIIGIEMLNATEKLSLPLAPNYQEV